MRQLRALILVGLTTGTTVSAEVVSESQLERLTKICGVSLSDIERLSLHEAEGQTTVTLRTATGTTCNWIADGLTFQGTARGRPDYLTVTIDGVIAATVLEKERVREEERREEQRLREADAAAQLARAAQRLERAAQRRRTELARRVREACFELEEKDPVAAYTNQLCVSQVFSLTLPD